MQSFTFSFSDIDSGEDEAKNDEYLDGYFVEFPGYSSVLKGKKDILLVAKVLENLQSCKKYA